MKKTITKLGKGLAIQIAAFSILIGGVAFATITFPTSTPAGQTAGGKFQTYFNNLFKSCPTGQVITGVKNDGTLICSTSTANIITQTRNDAGVSGSSGATNGFFQTSSPVNYPAGANSWWHLIDSRHTTNSNNYAMQIAGSFFNQDLYFRKTNNKSDQPWSKVVAENGSGNVGIGNNNPGASLDVSGKTIKLSNLYPEYNWSFGGGTDLNWKKIADVTMGTQLYSAMSMKVSIIDAMSNHGHSENMKPIDFYISARRSGASLNDRNNGAVSGPISDYVTFSKN